MAVSPGDDLGAACMGEVYAHKTLFDPNNRPKASKPLGDFSD